jgi:MOSC domain-containing protein YiiM
MKGQVHALYIVKEAGGTPIPITEAHAVPGRGIEGDRYFSGLGTYSDRPGPLREVTLIELEAIDALERDHGIELAPGASRRNIVTEGVSLNPLVGCEFSVGNVRLRGVTLSEPCAHLARLTHPGVIKGLVHRGGLRAQVLTEGIIRVGDSITELELV